LLCVTNRKKKKKLLSPWAGGRKKKGTVRAILTAMEARPSDVTGSSRQTANGEFEKTKQNDTSESV
jgi:hypothetical protein